MSQYSESPPPSAGTAQAAKDTALTAKDEAASVAKTAAESGKDVAGSAAQSGRRLAHDAKDEAKDVAREAGRQTKDLMGQAKEQLTVQAADQQRKLAVSLRALGTELGTMADASDEPGVASDLVGQLASRTDEFARWLDEREPGSLLEEVKGFARQRPGAFLAVAAVAGLAAGRLTRGIKDESSSGSTDLTTTPDTPLYGEGPTGLVGGVGLGTGVGTVPPPPLVPSTPGYGTGTYGTPEYGATGAGGVGSGYGTDTDYGTGVGGVGTTPPPAPPTRQSVFPPVNDPLDEPFGTTEGDDDVPPSFPPGGQR